MKLLCMVGVMSLCLTGLASALPNLEWDRTSANIEMGPQDLKARVDYRVTNQGDAELRFNRVESSCGCTAALPEKRVLGAGESMVVTAVFEKGKRRGKNGSVLRVFLDGMSEPVARLKLEVDITEVMHLQPEILYWNAGKSGARAVELRLNRAHADRLGELSYNAERLQVTLDSSSQEKGVYWLTVEPLSYGASMREKLVVRALDASGAVVEEKRLYVFGRP